MANWDSKNGVHKPVVGSATKKKEELARELRQQGLSVEEIANRLGLSKSRINQYLR